MKCFDLLVFFFFSTKQTIQQNQHIHPEPFGVFKSEFLYLYIFFRKSSPPSSSQPGWLEFLAGRDVSTVGAPWWLWGDLPGWL